MNIKNNIENIIKKNLPKKRTEHFNGNSMSDMLGNWTTEVYNQALSQINPSLIADEGLKVVVEACQKEMYEALEEVAQYTIDGNKMFVNKNDIKVWIKALSHLSLNKDNKEYSCNLCETNKDEVCIHKDLSSNRDGGGSSKFIN